MYDDYIDAISSEILNDDEITSSICPGFIEDWDSAIHNVMVGRLPKCCGRSTTIREDELEEQESKDNKAIQRHIIYPIIRVEMGVKEVFLELFCPFCGTALTLRKNGKTGTTFYGCSAFPKCKYSIGEEELKEKILGTIRF